jgi:SMI1-KNR4 cell-wall
MDKLNSLKEIYDFLVRRGERVKGLKSNYIRKIELRFGVTLPTTYSQFLSLMGREAGNYMKGDSVFFDEIFSLKKGTEELIVEHNLDTLPDSAFVFWMNQGYQVAFFKIGEGENPPVYYFSEGQGMKGFEQKEHSLTDFFIAQLQFCYPEVT